MTTTALFNQAIVGADKVIRRLECITRELSERPPKTDPLSPEIRERVSAALDRHMAECES